MAIYLRINEPEPPIVCPNPGRSPTDLHSPTVGEIPALSSVLLIEAKIKYPEPYNACYKHTRCMRIMTMGCGRRFPIVDQSSVPP